MLAMVHRAFRSRRCRRSDIALWAVGLFGEPEDEVGAPVADVAADLEAAGSGAEVAPVAQGALGDPEVGAGFLEGVHVVAIDDQRSLTSGADDGERVRAQGGGLVAAPVGRTGADPAVVGLGI